MLCKFCNKENKNANSKRNHERLCKLNPDRQKSGFEDYNKIRPTQSPWNKGLTGFVHSDETKEKLRVSSLGRLHSEETKLQMSESRKQLYLSGWEPTCGRSKKYDYESPIAGKIKVDGTWELRVAKHLDSIGVIWKRNKKRFEYINIEGKTSTYQPDFYVDDWGTYLEVKGYETDLDKCKWSQFIEPLIVWRKSEVFNLED